MLRDGLRIDCWERGNQLQAKTSLINYESNEDDHLVWTEEELELISKADILAIMGRTGVFADGKTGRRIVGGMLRGAQILVTWSFGETLVTTPGEFFKALSFKPASAHERNSAVKLFVADLVSIPSVWQIKSQVLGIPRSDDRPTFITRLFRSLLLKVMRYC